LKGSREKRGEEKGRMEVGSEWSCKGEGIQPDSGGNLSPKVGGNLHLMLNDFRFGGIKATGFTWVKNGNVV